MYRWRDCIRGSESARHAPEALQRGDVVGDRRAAAHCRTRSVIEHTVECYHPPARRAVLERMRTGCVGGYHPSDGAECATGRIRWKAKAGTTRGRFDFLPRYSGAHRDCSVRDIDRRHAAHAAEIDYHTIANGA